ncbi:hypothetical protein BRADO5966 [Bradyrhizobium sp. ORS 278]|nr:hypothetical protein BRADO5966 [Bradyrhizobium sp. ORS 278]
MHDGAADSIGQTPDGQCRPHHRSDTRLPQIDRVDPDPRLAAVQTHSAAPA